jgi:2-polyprenyl-3-methyl-5-hydroxy-6-metoxy-1,4-benzoquinol methylase
MSNLRKEHWNNIYSSKKLEEVSWYQPIPETSLDFIINSEISKDEPIIDVGGGDSFLIDNLIKGGFNDLTVLDISEVAIERAKLRLGENAEKVNWIVSDIRDFNPIREYSVWHDRAVFHFLREKQDIQNYYKILLEGLKYHGRLVLGTFSEDGPERCCALDVKRYSTSELSDFFSNDFTTKKTINTIHQTPFNTEQAFSFIELIKN